MASKRKRRANAKKRKASSKRRTKQKGVQIGSKEVFNIYG